jgi:hypothetical protein
VGVFCLEGVACVVMAPKIQQRMGSLRAGLLRGQVHPWAKEANAMLSVKEFEERYLRGPIILPPGWTLKALPRVIDGREADGKGTLVAVIDEDFPEEEVPAQYRNEWLAKARKKQ